MAIFLICPLFSACDRLVSIPAVPKITGDQWLLKYPHMGIKIADIEFILAKPSSSLIVYLLAIITIAAGVRFLVRKSDLKSGKWWGIALLLWGAGTVFAGTSYQAFAYEIKCAGRPFCSFTSWYEIIYLILEVFSVNAILVAVAYSVLERSKIKFVKAYAFLNSSIYLATVLAGSFIPVKFLITFEMMLLFCIPGLAGVFVISSKNYFKHRDKLGISLFAACFILLFVMIFYYAYLLAGFTEILWRKGIWFSANDVLHIGLIIWMLFLSTALFRNLKDYDQ